MRGRSTTTIQHDSALFLDFDGTLVDLADRPDAVSVPPALIQALGALSNQLDGALAIVSGRPIAQLDTYLAPLRFASSGVHGAERRNVAGQLFGLPVPDLDRVIASLQVLVTRHPGLLLESKPGAVAVHYRQAPELENTVAQAMEAAAARMPEMALMFGKMVVELKPAAATKGRAVAAFMAEAPFAGRRPLFAGDDVTDESAFDFVQSLDGIGIKVGEGGSSARYRIDTPGAFRAWLQAAALEGAALARAP